MSYTIGTRLISGNRIEHATVLTNGMVMADAYENGWRWRSMMKLEDWLIISGDVKVMKDESFVSVGSEPAPAPVEQEQEAAPLPQRPVGTKLRWVLGEETYRIAIATANGILQVKCVADGAGDCLPRETTYSWERAKLKKTLFTTEEEWRASLPQGGEVTIVELPPKNTPVVVKGASDVEKVEQLASRFKVRAGVVEQVSPLKRREMLVKYIADYTRIIADSEATADRDDFEKKLCYSYKKTIAAYKRNLEQIDAMSEAEKNKREFYISRYAQSKQKLIVTLANGISTQISPSSRIYVERGSPALPHAIFCHHDRKFYSSLQEMNVFKGANGLPIIQASYRRRMIDLSHLFTPQEQQASAAAYDSGC
jgi:hypothetical protein